MEDSEKKGKVCVTGGTGFVASWLIMRLLQHGYTVNTTVRSHSAGSTKDISFLTNLPGAQESLHIFNADLENPDSFGPAIEGCVGVFHVAHPLDFRNRETEEMITNKSVKATLGILKACLNSKTVKRVVYTSSASTVMFNENGPDVFDEKWWSDIDYIRKMNVGASYAVSKTVTERAALEFAESNSLDVVSVIPTWIHGPFVCPSCPGSVKSSLAMIMGNEFQIKYPDNVPLVHTDDVASAHIFLFEYPEAKGRYICSAVEINVEKLIEFVSQRYPQFQILSKDSLIDDQASNTKSLSSKKLLDAGFRYKYGLEEMFDDAIECCKNKGCLRLLEHGYTVNTTVRPHPSGSQKNISFLTNLPGAQESLHIFNADLENPDSFEAAIEGCIGVFHVAHPKDFQKNETEEMITNKSVKATLGILKACLNSKTVKRVVYTSSAATVMFNENGPDVLDEEWWSDLDYIRKPTFGASYVVSKTVTERAAFEFGESNSLDVVSLIPTWIHGPSLSQGCPESVKSVLAMVMGNENEIKYLANSPLVHTDDIASAHVFLFEYPEAKGRYICSAIEITIEKLIEFISRRYPQFQILSKDSLIDEAVKTKSLSSRKLLDSGFRFKYGLEEMFDDAIECCKNKGFL